MDVARCVPPVVEAIKEILHSHPGTVDVHLHLRKGTQTTVLRLEDRFRVRPGPSLYADLKALLGRGLPGVSASRLAIASAAERRVRHDVTHPMCRPQVRRARTAELPAARLASRVPELPWSEEFQRRFDEERAKLGRFNVLICGKTGVGKSTLINAIFGAEVAATGNGLPVTMATEYFTHERLPLGVFDSQGFETGQSGDEILRRLREEIDKRQRLPITEQIHVVWYAVRAPDRRFERSQAEFVRALAGGGVPVILVMTQVPMREGIIHPDALELAAVMRGYDLPVRPPGHVVLTNARDDDWTTPQVHGLHELLDATAGVIPESVRAALEAAQRIDYERKRRRARVIIRGASAAAASTCAVPLPIADSAALFPIQMGMLAAISAAYGVPTPSGRLATAFGSIIMASGAATIGRYVAGSLLKLVPGVGSVTGYVIKASVASSVTLAMGYGWMSVNERLVRMSEEEAQRFLTSDAVRQAFIEAYRQRLDRPQGAEEGARTAAGRPAKTDG